MWLIFLEIEDFNPIVQERLFDDLLDRDAQKGFFFLYFYLTSLQFSFIYFVKVLNYLNYNPIVLLVYDNHKIFLCK